MNVLIDTNVLLSAALRDKLPERVVLRVAARDDLRWIVTPEILVEYTDILRRPRFGLDEPTLGRWAELLSMRTVNVGSPPEVPDFPRDPKDAHASSRSLSLAASFRFRELAIKGGHTIAWPVTR
jgi:predicted nucleic acid-binding protein